MRGAAGNSEILEPWGFILALQCQARAAFAANMEESDQPGGFKLSLDGTSPPTLPKLSKDGSSKVLPSSCRIFFIQWISSADGGTQSSNESQPWPPFCLRALQNRKERANTCDREVPQKRIVWCLWAIWLCLSFSLMIPLPANAMKQREQTRLLEIRNCI